MSPATLSFGGRVGLLLQIEQRPLADAIGVHHSETVLQPKFLNGEEVVEYAAYFLRI